MKRNLFKLSLVLFAMSLAFVFANVAHAEEITEPDDFVEETASIIGQTYTYVEDKNYTFTILDETQVKVVAVDKIDETQSVTIIMQYTYIDGILTISMLDEIIGEFIVEGDNTLRMYAPPKVDEPVDIPVDEPVDVPTVETPTETPTNEEVTFRDMVNDFLDKWLGFILATFGGAGGTAIVMLIAKKILTKITEEVRKSAETNKESNEIVSKANELLDNGLQTITSRVEDFKVAVSKKIEEFEAKYAVHFEKTMERIKECVDDIEELECNDEKFKELIALLVSSSPQLASNGYATKILELLNERSDSNE